MERSILRNAVPALAGALMLWACSCRSGGVVSPPEKDAPPASSRKESLDSKGNAGLPDTGRVYNFVERMPSFPGGERALMEYLHDHIHYPAGARENGIQGTVVVQFVVNPDGSLSDFTTVGPHADGGLAAEAMRVAEGMPGWRPGMQNGREVAVRYALPVRFVIQ